MLMSGQRIASTLLALVSLVVASGALAQTSSTPSPAFRATDSNGDGHVDRGEFHYRMMDAFFLLDQDKDGYLTPSELLGVTAQAIRAADTNSDGKLSAIEYVNQRFKEFEAADRNRDGVLTHVEVEFYDGFGRR
jgi:hypothetical protein